MSGRYYRALSMMHQRIQGNIEDLERSPNPDWLRISEMKRMRLSVKDQMRRVLEEGREADPQGSLARNGARPRRASTLSSDA